VKTHISWRPSLRAKGASPVNGRFAQQIEKEFHGSHRSVPARKRVNGRLAQPNGKKQSKSKKNKE